MAPYNFTQKILALFELPYPITVVMMFIAFIVGLAMGTLTNVNIHSFIFYSIIGFFTVFSFIGAFNTWNALSDTGSDSISKPYRPLPSKKITIKEASYYTVFLFLLFIFLLITFFQNKSIIIFSLAMIVVAILYSKPIRLKKFPIISDLLITITYTIFPLSLGWSLVNQLYNIPWAEFSLIFFFGLATLLSKNFEDYEADIKFGSKTLIILLGFKNSFLLVATFFAAFFVVLIGYSLSGIVPSYFLILLILILPLYRTFCDFKKDLSSKNAFSFFAKLTVLLAVVEIVLLTMYLYNIRG